MSTNSPDYMRHILPELLKIQPLTLLTSCAPHSWALLKRCWVRQALEVTNVFPLMLCTWFTSPVNQRGLPGRDWRERVFVWCRRKMWRRFSTDKSGSPHFLPGIDFLHVLNAHKENPILKQNSLTTLWLKCCCCDLSPFFESVLFIPVTFYLLHLLLHLSKYTSLWVYQAVRVKSWNRYYWSVYQAVWIQFQPCRGGVHPHGSDVTWANQKNHSLQAEDSKV